MNTQLLNACAIVVSHANEPMSGSLASAIALLKMELNSESTKVDIQQSNEFAKGVDSMARNCQAAIELVYSNKWSIAQFRQWLTAVLNNDTTILDQLYEVAEQLKPKC